MYLAMECSPIKLSNENELLSLLIRIMFFLLLNEFAEKGMLTLFSQIKLNKKPSKVTHILIPPTRHNNCHIKTEHKR